MGFHKESSTIIALQTGIPARTIRRYVQISKDPTREHDSCFFMTEDPSLGNEVQASMPFGNGAHTPLSSEGFKIDDQMDIDPTEKMNEKEKGVLHQLGSLCSTDEMSTVLDEFNNFDEFNKFFASDANTVDIFADEH